MTTAKVEKMRVAWEDIPAAMQETAYQMYYDRIDLEVANEYAKESKENMNAHAGELFGSLQVHFGEEVSIGIKDEGSFAFIYPVGRTSLNKANLKMNLITMGGLDPKVVDDIIAKSSKLGAAGDPYVKFTPVKVKG